MLEIGWISAPVPLAGLVQQLSKMLAQQNGWITEFLRALKAKHLFWGYHRIGADLHLMEQLAINKKRSLWLMLEHHLLVMPSPRFQVKRTPTGRKSHPIKSNRTA